MLKKQRSDLITKSWASQIDTLSI